MGRVAATILVAAALAGCTPKDSVESEDSPLLLEAEVVAILGVEDLGTRDLTDEPVARNPDPRGPCGAVVVAPDLQEAQKLAFVGVDVFVVEVVLQASEEAVAYLDGLLADVTEDCADFSSTTASGATQTFRDVTFAAAANLPERALAWTNRVDVDSQTGYIATGAFEASEYVVVIQVESGTAIPIGDIQALVRRAFERIVANA